MPDHLCALVVPSEIESAPHWQAFQSRDRIHLLVSVLKKTRTNRITILVIIYNSIIYHVYNTPYIWKEIQFKELSPMIAEAGKSEIGRAGQYTGNPGRGLQDVAAQAWRQNSVFPRGPSVSFKAFQLIR